MKLEEYENILRTGTPSARKMTPDEAKLWAEVSRVNTRLKQEMVAASFTVRALPGDLQEDAINILSATTEIYTLSLHDALPI